MSTQRMTLYLDGGVEAKIQRSERLPADPPWLRRFVIKVDGEMGQVILRPARNPEWMETRVVKDPGSKLQDVADRLNDLLFEGWQDYLNFTELTATKRMKPST